MNKNYNYKEKRDVISGGILWIIEHNSDVLNEIATIVNDFISKYPHPDYDLSIQNSLDNSCIQIECEPKNIPSIVEYIVNLEKGIPFEFIGENLITKSYVVRIPLFKGRLDGNIYIDKNGKLEKIL